MKILPYKPYSESAKVLRRSLGVKFKKANTRIKKRFEAIINWGHSAPAFDTTGIKVLNRPEAVRVASNKLLAFRKFSEKEVSTLKYTSDIEEAKSWIQDGGKVVCRTILNGNSGRGIVVARRVEELVPAPLYTRYFVKTNEFRVHIFAGQVIDYVEKKKRNGAGPEFDPLIRNHNKGWIFAREGVLDVPQVKEEAFKAIAALGLDFGAVDIAWNERRAVVLEVNTAPGLTGTTLTKYLEAIRNQRLR